MELLTKNLQSLIAMYRLTRIWRLFVNLFLTSKIQNQWFKVNKVINTRYISRAEVIDVIGDYYVCYVDDKQIWLRSWMAQLYLAFKQFLCE